MPILSLVSIESLSASSSPPLKKKKTLSFYIMLNVKDETKLKNDELLFDCSLVRGGYKN